MPPAFAASHSRTRTRVPHRGPVRVSVFPRVPALLPRVSRVSHPSRVSRRARSAGNKDTQEDFPPFFLFPEGFSHRPANRTAPKHRPAMGKGAQFEDYSRRAGVGGETGMASTSEGNGAPGGGKAQVATIKNTQFTSSQKYSVSLTNGRTGGGVVEDGSEGTRAMLAERRLLETQQVLVTERLQREITESVLAETARALSAVRKAAADSSNGANAFSKDGHTLKGGSDDIAEMLQQKLSLLRNECDVLKANAASKEIALRTAENRNGQLLKANGGDYMQIAIHVTEMTSADQDELVLNSKTLLDRAKELEGLVTELLTVDELRVRTLAELVQTMESRQGELKDKLRDHGLLDDDEYDDGKVWEMANQQGLFGGDQRALSAEAKAALAHMLEGKGLSHPPHFAD